MPAFKTIWFTVISVVCYVAGWFFVFRTDKVVAMARRNYENRKLRHSLLIQISPFADFVLKPSYPTFIRGGGIFLWVWVVVVDYLLVTGWLH